MQRQIADPERLVPDDVEWVVEWQLASCFPWLPPITDETVEAAPEPEGTHWPVHIRVGGTQYHLRLPVRDLARIAAWCHTVTEYRELLVPPSSLRRALLVLRTGLRRGMAGGNPLQRMGYGEDSSLRDEGNPGQR